MKLSTLGVILIILKLTGVVAWSWWLILLPFYFWFALFLIGSVAAISGIVAAVGLAAIADAITSKRKIK